MFYLNQEKCDILKMQFSYCLNYMMFSGLVTSHQSILFQNPGVIKCHTQTLQDCRYSSFLQQDEMFIILNFSESAPASGEEEGKSWEGENKSLA